MSRTYLPKCYARERKGDFGAFISIQFDAAALIEFVRANTNSRGGFNITVSPRREASEKGVTHSVALDTWEPTQKRQEAHPAPRREPNPPQHKQGNNDADDDVDFGRSKVPF